jgi:hypothetical protein
MPKIIKQNKVVSENVPAEINIDLESQEPAGLWPTSRFTNFVLPIGLSILLVAVGAIAFVYYNKTQKPGEVAVEVKASAEQVAADEVKALITEVGYIMLLPTGEQPTVATVSDLAKLKDQVFFNNAKLGDKILIYTNAKKAILYNPTTKKIIEVAPVNVAKDQATTKAATQKSKVLGTDDKKASN